MGRRSYWGPACDWLGFGSAIAMVLYMTFATHPRGEVEGFVGAAERIAAAPTTGEAARDLIAFAETGGIGR